MREEAGTVSRGAILVLVSLLVAILAVAIGFNVGGMRDQLLWRINPPRVQAIAVLPFENLSRDPAQEYFADGTAERLVLEMEQFATVRVISSRSVMRYKKAPKPLPAIARELNIDAVVQGGVLRTGERVRISANLIHAETNRHLWGKTYERDLSEIPRLQGELVRDVARKISAGLTPQQEDCLTSRRSVNPRAYEAYLRGAIGGQTESSEKHLRQAIQLDPSFVPAFESLASVIYMRNMYSTFDPKETYPAAKEMALKALNLDPNSPVAHNVLASVGLEYEWDFGQAEKEFKLTTEVAPNRPWGHHSYAHFLLSMGRNEQARLESRRLMDLNPAAWFPFACISWHDVVTGHHDEAEEHSARALSLGAPDQLVRLSRGWSLQQRNHLEEALTEFQKAVVGWQNAVFPMAALGHAYAVAGKEPAAREVLEKLLVRSKTEYVSPYEIAVVYAGLGDRDRAFEWLDKAFEGRASRLVYFRMDPRIWSLRSDARFQSLLRRMNFPQSAQD